MPAFLAKTGYQEPLDPVWINYAGWTPERLPLFARIHTKPAYAASCAGWMAGAHRAQLMPHDFFEVQSVRGSRVWFLCGYPIFETDCA